MCGHPVYFEIRPKEEACPPLFLLVYLDNCQIDIDFLLPRGYYLDRNRFDDYRNEVRLWGSSKLSKHSPTPLGGRSCACCGTARCPPGISLPFSSTGATISHHLSILRDAGLILDEKRGKYIYYELNLSVLDEILEWISSLKGEQTDETES